MATQFFGSEDVKQALKGATLVLPAVATGNVGELALDVCIASLAHAGHAHLAGRLEDPNVLPVVGSDAYGLAGPPAPQGGAAAAGALSAMTLSPAPPPLATALELFAVQGAPATFLLQQRAPAMKGRQEAAAQSLAAWARGAGVARVVVVCGLDAGLRRDAQITGPQVRYLQAATTPQQEGAPPGLAGAAPLEADYLTEEKTAHSLLPPWPLLGACEGAGLPATLLAVFATEGDNTYEALTLARAALSHLAASGALGAELGALVQDQAGTAAGAGSTGDVYMEAPPPPPSALGKLALRVPGSWAGLYGAGHGGF